MVLQSPRNSVNEYFNYKNAITIVLFTLLDANYNFMFVDDGCQGRISDSGTVMNTALRKSLPTKTLHLPQPVPLNRREKVFHTYFTGDAALPWSENLMKVYPGQYPKGLKNEFAITGSAEPKEPAENVFGLASSVF